MNNGIRTGHIRTQIEIFAVNICAAAKWNVESPPINAIGIDTAIIDYGQSSLYEAHRTLYAKNIPAFENLTSLERLPARGATIVGLPMKIKGGSGAPLRAIAILPAAR